MPAWLRRPVLPDMDAAETARLVSTFPEANIGPGTSAAALLPYVARRPQLYFDRDCYGLYIRWLLSCDKSGRSALRGALSTRGIDHSLLSLREVNSQTWHDQDIGGAADYDNFRVVDRHVHPAYLRLVESVLIPLARPVAEFSRVRRGKSAAPLRAWDIVQELQGTSYSRLVASYRHVMRNGIAHGDVTFGDREIRYRDLRGNEYSSGLDEVVRLVDDLLDECNGMVAALKVFLRYASGGSYRVPLQLQLEELQEESRTPWWSVDGCVESEVLSGDRQLIVFCRASSMRYKTVQWSAFRCGVLAECFAPGYDRYFVAIRAARTMSGWAAFRGKELRLAREKAERDPQDHSGYGSVLEEPGVFFKPRVRIPDGVARLGTLWWFVRTAWSAIKARLASELSRPTLACRDVEVHRNGWRAVVRGSVVLSGVEPEDTVAVLRRYRRYILRKVRRHARRTAGGWWVLCLPTGYSALKVYTRDFRLRRLKRFGLGAELVGVLYLWRIQRVEHVEIVGATVETAGAWRLAWNRAWLESWGGAA